jgi:hypothetical protein
VGSPFLAEERDGEREDEEVDGVDAGETGDVEATPGEGGAVCVVVGEDESGDEEEEADEGEGVVDDGPENTRQGGREVEEHDVDREQGAQAGEGGERRLATGRIGGRRM